MQFDVAIVGLGPTGATLANLLGAAGLRTVVYERSSAPYSQPRACHLDAEIARVFQGLGGAMMLPVGRLILLRVIPKSELVSAMAMLSIPTLFASTSRSVSSGFGGPCLAGRVTRTTSPLRSSPSVVMGTSSFTEVRCVSPRARTARSWRPGSSPGRYHCCAWGS